ARAGTAVGPGRRGEGTRDPGRAPGSAHRREDDGRGEAGAGVARGCGAGDASRSGRATAVVARHTRHMSAVWRRSVVGRSPPRGEWPPATDRFTFLRRGWKGGPGRGGERSAATQ